MGRMEDALKMEIIRLTRKELRATVVPLSKDIRELKRKVNRLTKAVTTLDSVSISEDQPRMVEKDHLEVSNEEVSSARISSKAIKNLRKKLGVSQEKLAVLLNVSPGAVAFWEQGRAKPRGENKAALVALRKLGRRDVKKILKEKGAPS